MSTTAICGCELLNAQGQPAINAAKAVAFELNLIQERGYQYLNEVDSILNPMVPVRPGNPNEGELPRDYIEYRFFLSNTDLASVDNPFASGTTQADMTIQTSTGPQTFNDVTQTSGGSPMCDNRSVQLVAGQDIRRGIYTMLPDIESPCICISDFARTSDFGGYLQQLRGAMPRENGYVKERVLLRKMVEFSQYNTSEMGDTEPVFTAGTFPSIPTSGANISTFRRIRDRMQALGHGNEPIEVPISGPSLQAMMVAYYRSMGIYRVAETWADGAFPDEWTNGGTWTFERIKFISKSLPIKGIFQQTTTGGYQFFPISPRQFRKGTGAGIVDELNPEYFQTVVTRNGAQYEVFELSPVVSKKAFYQQPYVQNQIPIEGLNQDGTMWQGTTARVIGGAFIPCNEKLLKFKIQLSTLFKIVPKMPYLSGFVAFRSASYIWSPNTIGLNNQPGTASGDTIVVSGGSQPNASSCADQRAGLYPQDPAPGPITSVCDTPGNSAGKFVTNCSLVTTEDGTSIVLTVERINGYAGAASLGYATANGTASSGTDYTSTSGTLSWAAGEFGAKTITVPLLAGARNGKTFTVAYSGATGASLITDGCTSTTITISRPAQSYQLASGLTGTIASMVVDGGSFPLPNAPYAATGAGADALQDDINDALNGDGYANVSWTGSAWAITVTDTKHIFTSATNGTGTTKNFSVI